MTVEHNCPKLRRVIHIQVTSKITDAPFAYCPICGKDIDERVKGVPPKQARKTTGVNFTQEDLTFLAAIEAAFRGEAKKYD